MAIHNSIFLFGRVHGQPLISYNETKEEIVKVVIALSVISNRERTFNLENKNSVTTILLISQNKEIMKKMTELENNDVIQVKGTLTTRNYTKRSVCEKCGTINVKEGIMSFVNPIYLNVIKTKNSREEAMNLVRKNFEVSNIATIIGTLCREPELHKSEDGEITTQYQLAIDRKYRIKEDHPLIRTDYPWVKSYGSNAEMDHICLETGSCVFIDGLLRSRQFQRRTICDNEECKEEYSWTDRSLEIIPYSTEYLKNFMTPEEREAEKKKELRRAVSELLSDED